VKVGADVNLKCKLGWTPLHYAAYVHSSNYLSNLNTFHNYRERGHDAVVELLLNNGAAVEAGKHYRNGRVELSPVDMAQSLTIRNKLEGITLTNLILFELYNVLIIM
jgi:ankyrin repeat protein